MFDRIPTRSRLIALAALITALSIFLASATDVGAVLAVSEPAARAAAVAATPIEIPREWVWRGPEPVSLEFMYGNRPQPQSDWIRMNHAQ
jgi:hypothetical protein